MAHRVDGLVADFQQEGETEGVGLVCHQETEQPILVKAALGTDLAHKAYFRRHQKTDSLCEY